MSEKEKEQKPNVKDYRKQQLFKMYPDGIKEERHNWMIPKNATNELLQLIAYNPKEKELVPIGDVEIGSDGFFEMMFHFEGRIIKIDRKKNEEKVVFVATPPLK